MTTVVKLLILSEFFFYLAQKELENIHKQFIAV